MGILLINMVQEGTTCDLFRCSSHVYWKATCSVCWFASAKNVHQHIDVYPWPALSKLQKKRKMPTDLKLKSCILCATLMNVQW